MRRPEKKRQKAKAVQPPLPGMPPHELPGTARVLPMQLQIGDRMTDSTGEWEVVWRPYTTAGGKNSHVRVQRVDKPGVTMEVHAACCAVATEREGAPRDPE